MNGFEIQNIPGKGRAMIATKPFKINETIFEEEAFVSCQFSWNRQYGYLSCDHCMRPLETTQENICRLASDKRIVLPFQEHCPTKYWINEFTECQKCGTKYCSEDCKMEALKKYHLVSCMGQFRHDDSHPINLLETTWKQMHFPPETGSIMLIVRILAMYKKSKDKNEFMETLKSFQSIYVNEENKIYHKILGANFEQQLEQLYNAFCNAFSDEEFAIFTTPNAFKSLMALIGTNSQGIATSALAEWVKKVSDINIQPDDKKQLDKFIDDLYNKIIDYSGEFLNNEGSGLYQLQSKINHSCVPNVQSSFPYSNDILVLKSIKDIYPGDEICISYLDDCQLARSRHSRHKELTENYLFICNCEKCLTQINDPDETSEDDEEDISDVEMDDADD